MDAAGNVYVADVNAEVVYRIGTGGGIAVLAGNGIAGYGGDGGPASDAQISAPSGLAVDGSGNIYIADTGNQRVRKVDALGNISTMAGNGTAGFAGDGGPAASAQLSNPTRLAIDAGGNIYIADTANHRIRKINTSGIIATVAGNGSGGYNGDAVPAITSSLNLPAGLAVDRSGNLYIADTANQRIREVDGTGNISTVAGTGAASFTGDGGPATSAALDNPYGIAFDRAGNLYIADSNNLRVRIVSQGGIITTFAGNGSTGFGGDGQPAISAALSAFDVVADGQGNVYVADADNARIRQINNAGTIVTYAGGGTYAINGDGGPATAAQLLSPSGVSVDSNTNAYVVDTANMRIRRVDASGTITTVAGNGTTGFSGDNGPASAAQLNNPTAVANDAAGNVYIADQGNNRVRMIDGTGVISTIAGGGSIALPALDVGMDATNVATDPTNRGNVYIADPVAQRIFRVDPSGTFTLFAGNGTAGYSGDGGPAGNAQFTIPAGLAVDPSGNVYVADSGNCVIRKIDGSVNVSTIAGNGSCGYAGDGGPATSAQLSTPVAVALDPSGNLYIADLYNSVIRVISAATGMISTFAGGANGSNGNFGYAGDGGPATSALLGSPIGVTVDPSSGAVYISDAANYNVRVVTADGNIATYAGDGSSAASGDNGPATSASFDPRGIVFDQDSRTLMIADPTNCAVRVIDTYGDLGPGPAGQIYTFAGGGHGEGNGGPATSAYICPNDVASSVGWLYAADYDSGNVRKIHVRADPTNRIISNFAGNGSGVFVVPTFSGDGGNATAALLLNPSALSLDAAGNIYVADTGNQRVRKISSGVITTVAGNGVAGFGGDGTSAVSAWLNNPAGVVTDNAGNLYISDQSNNRLRKVDTTGTITTIAGGMEFEGIANSAHFAGLAGLAVDAAGNVYVSVPLVGLNDAYSPNGPLLGAYQAGVIYRIVTGDAIGVFAGCPSLYTAALGSSGCVQNSGPALQFYMQPSAMAFDPTGNLYFWDFTQLQRIDTNQNVTTLFSSGYGNFCGQGSVTVGNGGGSFVTPLFQGRAGMAADNSGNIYFSDPASDCVYRYNPGTSVMSVIAGNGTFGYSGDGGAGVNATLNYPVAVAADGHGSVFIADELNARIRKVDSTGIITTFAGGGTSGLGDGGPATNAQINPINVAVDSAGDVFITESARIRKVDTSGNISTIAGDGTVGLSGDGGPARAAQISAAAVSVDGTGNVYIADVTNLRIRKIDASGTITSIAGPGISNFGTVGDGGPAASAGLRSPTGLTLDQTGALYVADTGNALVRRIDATGTISTVAGTGTVGYSGDGGAPTAAQLNSPTGVFVDTGGKLFIADQGNNRIRVFAAPTPQTISITAAPSTMLVGGVGTITATGGASANAVTFTSATPTICSVSGSTITALAAGSCTVLADQAGNANYLAATEVHRAIAVNPAPQVITITSVPAVIAVGGTGTVAAAGGASRNPVAFTSNTSAICSVSGYTVSGIAVGACTLTANQAGNANYVAASPVNATIAIVQPTDTATPASLAFGNVAISQSTTAQSITVSNTGIVALTLATPAFTITGAGTNGAEYTVVGSGATPCGSGLVLPPSSACTAIVTFVPAAINGAGAKPATLSVLSNATPKPISLTGAAVQATDSLAPTPLPFGSVQIGTSSGPSTATVTNTGTVPLTLSTPAFALAGANPTEYVAVGGGTTPCANGLVLPVAGTCTIQVTFSPTVALGAGSKPAALQVFSDATTKSAALTGMAVAPTASVAPATLGFGSVQESQSSAPLTATVTNSGTVPLTLASFSATGTNPTEYSATGTGTTPCANNLVLPVSGTCTIAVTFSPTLGNGAGSKPATLSIFSNAATKTVSLSGTATVPTFTVTPTALTFGSVQTGISGAPLTVTVNNTGFGPLTLATPAFTLAGANPTAYSAAGSGSTPCYGGQVLPSPGTCTISVTFSPVFANGTGAKPATLSVMSSGTTKNVSLAGTSVAPAPSLGAGTYNFGAGATTRTALFTLTNTGTTAAPFIIGSISAGATGTGPGQYSVVSGGTCATGSTIAVASTCTVKIQFVPNGATITTGTLTITGTGVGAATPTYSANRNMTGS